MSVLLRKGSFAADKGFNFIGPLGDKALRKTNFLNKFSLDFDGVDDEVSIPFSTDFGALVDFSAFAWIKTTATDTIPIIFSHWNPDATRRKWFIAMRTNILEVLITNSGSQTTDKTYRSVALINDGNWHSVGFTFANDDLKLYLDGVLLTGGTLTIVNDDSFAALFNNTTDPLKIGSIIRAADPFSWNDNIDEVSYWDAVLTANDITTLYNNGKPNNLRAHPKNSNLKAWYRNGDGDTFPTIQDNKGSNDGTMTNMTAGDIVADVP